MAKQATEAAGKAALARQVRELEARIRSQEDLEALIEELQIHQEEIRIQNAAMLETQQELEASRDRYAELYDFAPIAFASLDGSGIIVSLNLAAIRLLGVDRSRALGVPLGIYVADHSRRPLLDFLGRCRRDDGPPPPIEIALRSGAGEEPIPVELTIKRLQPVSGAPIYFAALHDLRERRRADAERLRAMFERERLGNDEAAVRLSSQAKDRFLAVLSHELRAPLTPILLTLERFERAASLDEATLRSGIETIRRNLTAEIRLTDDLFDLTRVDRNELHLGDKAVDLLAAIRQSIDMCAKDLESGGLLLAQQLDASPTWVRGDTARLRQVFWNLLSNAIRYTAPGGTVSVRTSLHDGYVRVEVADAGRGVEPDDHEGVFQPFEQAKGNSRETGLGLAICRDLVKAHGGKLRAARAGRGRGTTFTVELPTCAGPPQAGGQRPAGPDPHPGLRVLLVEDNEDTAEALSALLRMYGYEVQLARTLDEARRAWCEPFDVLLSDLQLPDGSGLDLVRELATDQSVPAIAISGYGTESDLKRSLDAGFARHLVKPVAIEHIIEAIEALTFSGSRSQSASSR